MYRIQAKLIEWKNLYLALSSAQDRLRQAQSRKKADAELAALQAEVDRLSADSEAALLEVQDHVAKIRSDRSTGSPGSQANR